MEPRKDSALNPAPTVEVLYPAQAICAEGPFYEEESNSLLWVDIPKNSINFYDLTTSQNKSFEFSQTASAIIPVEGTRQLVVLLGRRICLVDRDTGTLVEVLATVQEDKPTNRFNDGKCDSSGRFWCGTMAVESSPGNLPRNEGFLYCYSEGSLKQLVTTSLSNGLEWNTEDNIMYYIDSPAKSIYTFAYSSKDGTISQQEVLIDYAKDAELAIPDGMCRDTEGRLWVASFGGQRVTCWDPKTKEPERVMTLRIPGAKNITSCCFGGPNYEWLFVTSARYGLNDEELADYPNSGALFVVKNLGARGTPAHMFKL